MERFDKTQMEKLKKLYYKALHDAKLNDTTERHSEQERGLPTYSTEEFSRWARKIDIYTLGKGAADFSKRQHEEIVKEFGDYRLQVTAKLSGELLYEGILLPGQLKDIGSCIDGSKVGSVNEMDSFYVLHGNSFLIRKSDKDWLYRVFLAKDSTRVELEPRNLREQFADEYSNVLSELTPPSCLQHGGYKRSSDLNYQSPVTEPHGGQERQDLGYSGVRYNGPAVTSQFLAKDESLLTWDITPVLVLTDGAEICHRVRESMQAIISDNSEKMFPPTDVQLFPDATVNLWRLTTAQMEADVLGRMSRNAPFKEAFSSSKVLGSGVKDWNKKHKRPATPDMLDIVTELVEYQAMEDPVAKMKAAQTLNRKMRFAHIWLPTDLRQKFHEDSKSEISINNAAVKHILLRAAFRIKGAFGPERNPEIVKQLIRTAFEVLSNDKSYSCEHAFLPGMRISHFSVAPGMASQKQALVSDMIGQCSTLLQEAMTNVRKRKYIAVFGNILSYVKLF